MALAHGLDCRDRARAQFLHVLFLLLLYLSVGAKRDLRSAFALYESLETLFVEEVRRPPTSHHTLRPTAQWAGPTAPPAVVLAGVWRLQREVVHGCAQL